MAFFPRNFYNSDASFTPLFRLLDDFDKYSNQGQTGRRGPALPSWQPKFDVRETGDAYELHGEFPGVEKENVHIEFTDPQTMLIRGKTERTYTAGTPPAGLVQDTAVSGAITEGEEAPKSPSHQATVEDEYESVSHESNTVAPVEEEKSKEQTPADKAKYWLTERSVGEFSRSFNFPTRVDQDNVSANFKDGILSILVPKAKKHESRRITVN
ncbi:Fc.00g067670.m01.CDS01 [Cosmosporella sp. VM-42]